MTERNLKYSDDEAPIVRRLGAAVVLVWNDLSEEQQNSIVREAVFVFDEKQTVQLEQQIREFIRSHVGEP